MKKLVLLLCLFAAIGMTAPQAFSQTEKTSFKTGAGKKKKTPAEKAKKQVAKWGERLNLTNDQAAKMREAAEVRITKVRAAKKAENKKDIKAARKEYKGKLQTILSEDQYAKYKEIKAELKKARKEKKAAKEAEDLLGD